MNEHQNKSLARTNFGIEILNSHPTTLRLLIIWETISNIRESVSSVKQCFLYTLDPLLVFFFWISDKTLFLMCDISLQSIWISNETLPLMFDVTPGYQVKHSFSFVVYHFSMFGYQINHSFPRLSTRLLSDAIPGKTLFLVFDIVFLRVWISDETLSSRCLDTRRGYKITLWIFQEREKMSCT